MLIEFTTYDRPRQLASITTMSTMEIRGSLSFEPVPEGTRMHWSWTLKPRGLLRLMAPIVSRLGRRQEEAIWTGLKRVLEERNARSYA